MALTDNLVVKVQPASGDTYVKNLITVEDVAASGAGTLTLVDDAGLYGWQVQGARNGNFTGGATYEGGALTVAVRFKANSRAADFAQYFAVGTATSSYYGAQITNNGSSTGTLRARESIAGGGFTTIGSPTYTTGAYFTIVLRLRDNGFNGGTLDAFLKQTGRSSNNPDYSVAAAAAVRTGTVDDLILGATSQNLTFVDIAVWTRDLTDAEAASVADDIRGVFGVGAGATITAASGTYSVTGQAASLRAARVLVAGSGTYALTGQAATLTYTQPGAYSMSAGHGTYSITGSAALGDYAMRAEYGTYAVSGMNASLLWSGATIGNSWKTYARRRGRR